MLHTSENNQSHEDQNTLPVTQTSLSRNAQTTMKTTETSKPCQAQNAHQTSQAIHIHQAHNPSQNRRPLHQTENDLQISQIDKSHQTQSALQFPETKQSRQDLDAAHIARTNQSHGPQINRQTTQPYQALNSIHIPPTNQPFQTQNDFQMRPTNQFNSVLNGQLLIPLPNLFQAQNIDPIIQNHQFQSTQDIRDAEHFQPSHQIQNANVIPIINQLSLPEQRQPVISGDQSLLACQTAPSDVQHMSELNGPIDEISNKFLLDSTSLNPFQSYGNVFDSPHMLLNTLLNNNIASSREILLNNKQRNHNFQMFSPHLHTNQSLPEQILHHQNSRIISSAYGINTEALSNLFPKSTPHDLTNQKQNVSPIGASYPRIQIDNNHHLQYQPHRINVLQHLHQQQHQHLNQYHHHRHHQQQQQQQNLMLHQPHNFASNRVPNLSTETQMNTSQTLTRPKPSLPPPQLPFVVNPQLQHLLGTENTQNDVQNSRARTATNVISSCSWNPLPPFSKRKIDEIESQRHDSSSIGNACVKKTRPDNHGINEEAKTSVSSRNSFILSRRTQQNQPNVKSAVEADRDIVKKFGMWLQQSKGSPQPFPLEVHQHFQTVIEQPQQTKQQSQQKEQLLLTTQEHQPQSPSQQKLPRQERKPLLPIQQQHLQLQPQLRESQQQKQPEEFKSAECSSTSVILKKEVPDSESLEMPEVLLKNADVWQTVKEVVISDEGRPMFPFISVAVNNLDLKTMYDITLQIDSMDSYLYDYIGSEWKPIGYQNGPDIQNVTIIYQHPDSPRTGGEWGGNVDFDRLRLSQKLGGENTGIVILRRKYYPTLLIKAGQQKWEYPIKEAAFVTVNPNRGPLPMNCIPIPKMEHRMNLNKGEPDRVPSSQINSNEIATTKTKTESSTVKSNYTFESKVTLDKEGKHCNVKKEEAEQEEDVIVI